MPLSVGTRLGPYEILVLIGTGGMGEVYKARDTRLDREVAIKIVAEHFSQRFESEAHAIAALNHPHICALHDIGPNYLVMEYIEGETLEARIKKGPLPTDEMLKAAIQVAAGLGTAHRKGIVHHDLKPGNIMLTATGAKLLDFGLAKYQQPTPMDEGTKTMALTGEAQVVGTLPYMSPEQLEGKEANHRSDIFAFGAVLYEMVTGRRTFQRQSTIDKIAAVGREEPKPLHEFVKDVPDGLERIVRRCLRKRPEERYATMGEVERDLEDCRALASEPISGINLKVLFRQSKRPSVAIPAVLILLALGGLAVPGDVPNRFLAWGTLHLPWELQLMPKMEYRTGFPYSSLDAREQYAGVPNQSRFPSYLSVDARISKDIKVSDKYTLRFSIVGSNLTDHFNPISVHANIADPLYGVFFGEYRRRYKADFNVIF